MKNEETNQDNIRAYSEIPDEREHRVYWEIQEAESSKVADMTTEELAAKHRLTTTTDECGDSIIPGKRGHLYCDNEKVCAMWVDRKPILKTRLVELGGSFWQGAISLEGRGHRVQDACVKGISLDRIPLALRLLGAKRRRTLSEAQRSALAKARAASPLIFPRTRAGTHSLAVESIAEAQVIPNYPGGPAR
jgi:hypothetical protein